MMKNPFIIPVAILGIIVLIVAGFIIFQPKMVVETSDTSTVIDTKDKEMMKPETQASSGAMMEKQVMMNDQAMMSTGYLNYSADILEKTVSSRRVLFFYANWCPTCKVADESFNANLDKLPSNLALIKINYSDSETDASEKELARKYGITYQHTFVQIDSQGKEITKWNGGQIKELLANIK
jgi:thiol-disulfide isomerase/thioredoxin